MIRFTISKKTTIDDNMDPVKTNYYLTVAFSNTCTLFCRSMEEVKQKYKTLMGDLIEAIEKPEKYVIYFNEIKSGQPSFLQSQTAISLSEKRDLALVKKDWAEFNKITNTIWTEQILPTVARQIGVDVVETPILIELVYKENIVRKVKAKSPNDFWTGTNVVRADKDTWDGFNNEKTELRNLMICDQYKRIKNFDVFSWIEYSLNK